MESGPDRLAERSATKTFAQGEKGYYIVQFDGPIRTRQKKKLEKRGVRVLDYLPDFAFIVKMNDETRAAVESMKEVRWVGIYQPAYRKKHIRRENSLSPFSPEKPPIQSCSKLNS
jgi:hypothetical protein